MGSTVFGSPRLRFLVLALAVSGFTGNVAEESKPQLLSRIAMSFEEPTHDYSLGRISVATMTQVG